MREWFPSQRWLSILVSMVMPCVLLVPSRLLAQDLQFVLEASQESVVAGKPITFTGRHFVPKEGLTYWVTTPDKAVISGRSFQANAEGNFSFTFEVPRDAISGQWIVTVWGKKSKTPVMAQFEVVGQSPEAAKSIASVQPEQGPPGTTFVFTARGYRSSERVSYWITAPDNTIAFAKHRGAKPNKHGEIQIHWTAPRHAQPGRWVITMQGIRSSVARAIPFTIETPPSASQPPSGR